MRQADGKREIEKGHKDKTERKRDEGEYGCLVK